MSALCAGTAGLRVEGVYRAVPVTVLWGWRCTWWQNGDVLLFPLEANR